MAFPTRPARSLAARALLAGAVAAAMVAGPAALSSGCGPTVP